MVGQSPQIPLEPSPDPTVIEDSDRDEKRKEAQLTGKRMQEFYQGIGENNPLTVQKRQEVLGKIGELVKKRHTVPNSVFLLEETQGLIDHFWILTASETRKQYLRLQGVLREHQNMDPLLAGILEDAYQQLESDERCKNAEMDSLTGLFRRPTAVQDLEYRVQESGVVVLLLDLDDFKGVNDNFGHDTGDDVLSEIGERIRRFCDNPPPELQNRKFRAYRIGGEEFVMMFSIGVAELTKHDVLEIIEKFYAEVFGRKIQIREKNKQGKQIEQPAIRAEITQKASMGITTSFSSDADPDQLISQADAAAYEAKKQKNEISLKKRIVFYKK